MLLERHQIDVTVQNDDGNTALHYFARNPVTCTHGCLTLALSRHLLGLFVKEGVDINDSNATGETPLHAAVWKGRTDMVKLLLEFGADPCKASSIQLPCSHFSILSGTPSKFLVHQNFQGQSPLNWAQLNRLEPIVHQIQIVVEVRNRTTENLQSKELFSLLKDAQTPDYDHILRKSTSNRRLIHSCVIKSSCAQYGKRRRHDCTPLCVPAARSCKGSPSVRLDVGSRFSLGRRCL